MQPTIVTVQRFGLYFATSVPAQAKSRTEENPPPTHTHQGLDAIAIADRTASGIILYVAGVNDQLTGSVDRGAEQRTWLFFSLKRLTLRIKQEGLSASTPRSIFDTTMTTTLKQRAPKTKHAEATPESQNTKQVFCCGDKVPRSTTLRGGRKPSAGVRSAGNNTANEQFQQKVAFLPRMYVGDLSFSSRGSSFSTSLACLHSANKHFAKAWFSTWPQSNGSCKTCLKVGATFYCDFLLWRIAHHALCRICFKKI